MAYIYGSPSRSGPEAELVQRFIRETVFFDSPDGLSQSVFIEPDLEFFVPDIVIVLWDPCVTIKWSEQRQLLKNIDYKLIHHLYIQGEQTDNDLMKFFPKGLTKILDRLSESEIISSTNSLWKLNAINEIFAVERIISFEAKISAASKAIEQAYLYTLFSSESYLLTKSKKPTTETIHKAKDKGVGICSYANGGYSNTILPPKDRSLPQSHLSWVLNDLVWERNKGAAYDDKC